MARKFVIEKLSKEGGEGDGSENVNKAILKSKSRSVPRNEEIIKKMLEIKVKAAKEAKEAAEREAAAAKAKAQGLSVLGVGVQIRIL